MKGDTKMFKSKNKVDAEFKPNYPMITTVMKAIHYHISVYEHQNEREDTRIKDYSPDFFLYEVDHESSSLVGAFMHQLLTRLMSIGRHQDLFIQVIEQLPFIAKHDPDRYVLDDVGLDKPFNEYINRVLVNKRWGSLQVEYFAMAQYFDVCIQIHMQEPRPSLDIYGDPDNPRTLHIAYNGLNKYDSLIKREEYLQSRAEENAIAETLPKNIYKLNTLLNNLQPLLKMLQNLNMPLDEQVQVHKNICQVLNINENELILERQDRERVIENDEPVKDHPSMSLTGESTSRKMSIKWDDLAYPDPPSRRRSCDLS
jgi:hypothetical protein